MAFLGRGGDGHHYECVDAENGTLMRHFLRSAFAPGALPGRMEQCTAEARLEANAGAVYRLAPADRRAVTRAVLVAAVTVGANAHLRGAPPATIESIRLPACPHAPHALHWTKPRNTGINARQPRSMRARNGRPGVLPRIGPGLRLSGVCKQDTAGAPPTGGGYSVQRVSAVSVRG